MERQRPAETQAIEAGLTPSGWPGQQQTLAKVRQPRAGVSALVDVWWQGGWPA